MGCPSLGPGHWGLGTLCEGVSFAASAPGREWQGPCLRPCELAFAVCFLLFTDGVLRTDVAVRRGPGDERDLEAELSRAPNTPAPCGSVAVGVRVMPPQVVVVGGLWAPPRPQGGDVSEKAGGGEVRLPALAPTGMVFTLKTKTSVAPILRGPCQTSKKRAEEDLLPLPAAVVQTPDVARPHLPDTHTAAACFSGVFVLQKRLVLPRPSLYRWCFPSRVSRTAFTT